MLRRISVAALVGATMLSAACERGRTDAGKAGPAADTPAADTSALGIARSVLGPQVRVAVPFTIQPRDARFIAAALPVTERVDDVVRPGNSVAPGGHEMVILELRGGSWAVHKPGLYASREPFLERPDDDAPATPADSARLARMLGVEDADGDGFPEVWSAQFQRGGRGYAWEVRAFSRDGRILYRGELGGMFSGRGLDPRSFSFSESAGEGSAARQWLIRKAEALDAQFRAQGSGEDDPDSAAAAGAPR